MPQATRLATLRALSSQCARCTLAQRLITASCLWPRKCAAAATAHAHNSVIRTAMQPHAEGSSGGAALRGERTLPVPDEISTTIFVRETTHLPYLR